MKKSKTLYKRAKLTKEQLERIRGQAGNGLASRYDDDGIQSLALTRRLAKAKKKAKKFCVYSDTLGKRVYIADSLEDYPLTFDIKESLTFYEGFDDATRKKIYWGNIFPQLKLSTTWK